MIIVLEYLYALRDVLLVSVFFVDVSLVEEEEYEGVMIAGTLILHLCLVVFVSVPQVVEMYEPTLLPFHAFQVMFDCRQEMSRIITRSTNSYLTCSRFLKLMYHLINILCFLPNLFSSLL